MATTVVQKYGGSSLASQDDIRAVAELVVSRHRSGDRVVVVVSAMGTTTETLLAQAAKISVAPSRRELDMLVTAGERISMALMSMAIQELGEKAISFTGSQSGIITENAHQGARILEVIPWRIEEALDTQNIVIVAGYQGVSRAREVTTLGRGGSDTTAVALAAALGAASCEIYSDVDGVYSADPRICPQAKHLSELSYDAMRGLASAGARVLNAEAVRFAERAGIAIVARKTGDSDGRQTRVHASPRVREVRAVTAWRSAFRLVVSFDSWRVIEPAVIELNARACGLWPVNGRVEVWLDFGNAADESPTAIANAVAQLDVSDGSPSPAVAERGSVVSVFAADAWCLREQARRLLDEAGIRVVSFNVHDTILALFVESCSTDKSVRLLHAAFVEHGHSTTNSS